mmetsp:Transcript_18624/g.56228  ORF Transcript_18624/g.56228 Transcript_18624/m.56228 type:complete len:170 (-) Transcript_18624:883-1392(-)
MAAAAVREGPEVVKQSAATAASIAAAVGQGSTADDPRTALRDTERNGVSERGSAGLEDKTAALSLDGTPIQASQLQAHMPPAAQAAAELLGQRFRVEVVDGRVLEGDFSCLDTMGNLILSHACQTADSSGASCQQQMGLVLLPSEQRLSCSVFVPPGNEQRMQALVREA